MKILALTTSPILPSLALCQGRTYSGCGTALPWSDVGMLNSGASDLALCRLLQALTTLVQQVAGFKSAEIESYLSTLKGYR